MSHVQLHGTTLYLSTSYLSYFLTLNPSLSFDFSRRICNCKLGFPSELRSEKGQIEFLEAAARVDAIFKNPSLIYGKPKSVQVLVPKVVVASPPPPPLPPPIQAIVTPNASAIVDGGGVGDAAEELLSAQTKRAAMQKKAAAASVAAEDFARRFESGDMAEVSSLLNLSSGDHCCKMWLY